MLTQIKIVLVAILVVALAVSLSVGMWYRTQVKEQEVKKLKAELVLLKEKERLYQKNLADIKEQRRKDQIVLTAQGELINEIQEMQNGKCISREDEKTLTAITDYFNYRAGLLKTDSSAGQVLSASGETSAGRWTIKMIAKNYSAVITYSLLQENCIECLLE